MLQGVQHFLPQLLLFHLSDTGLLDTLLNFSDVPLGAEADKQNGEIKGAHHTPQNQAPGHARKETIYTIPQNCEAAEQERGQRQRQRRDLQKAVFARPAAIGPNPLRLCTQPFLIHRFHGSFPPSLQEGDQIEPPVSSVPATRSSRASNA